MRMRDLKVHITYYDYKDRLFVGGHVHKHMCKTAFLVVIHGKQMCGLQVHYVHITDNTCVQTMKQFVCKRSCA